MTSAEIEARRDQFDQRSGAVAAAVRHRLDTNEAILAGFAAFLHAVDRGDSGSAARFAAWVVASYPHIYMLEVARRVPLADQQLLEASLRKGWRADFALKDFSQITRRPASDTPAAAETWPILFLHPSSPETSEIYGLRLETVGHLASTIELAKARARPLSTPTFELFEGGSAYILLQRVARTPRRTGAGVNFFGDTMMAMLLIRTAALEPSQDEEPGAEGMHYTARLHSANDTQSVLFERRGAETGLLDRFLLPRFSRDLRIDNRSQPTSMHFEQQLRLQDLARPGLLVAMAMLGGSLLLAPWLAYRHFAALEHAEIQHARSAYLATHDLLTDLPNRFLFADRFDQALKRWQRDLVPFVLLLADLDGFKEVNDRHGHEAGDQVLVEAARRMRAELRDRDTVARHGGDEFVVLLAGTTSAEAAKTVVAKLRTAISAPIVTTAGPMQVSCSIGIAVCPDDGERLDALLRCADRRMYLLKSDSRSA